MKNEIAKRFKTSIRRMMEGMTDVEVIDFMTEVYKSSSKKDLLRDYTSKEGVNIIEGYNNNIAYSVDTEFECDLYMFNREVKVKNIKVYCKGCTEELDGISEEDILKFTQQVFKDDNIVDIEINRR